MKIMPRGHGQEVAKNMKPTIPGPLFGVVNGYPESPLRSYNWTPLGGAW